MRIRGLPIPLLCLALAACQSVDLRQDNAPQAHANIGTSHLDVGTERVDTFRVVTIDGRPAMAYTDEPAKTIDKDTSSSIDAGRTVRVEIEGLARYRNPVRSLFWNAMHVEGKVEFVPAPDGQYAVHGEIGATQSWVWLEDEKTHEVVTHKFVAPHADPASGPEHETVPRGSNL